MKKMILWSALILTSNLLTGCIGLVVDHPREKSTTQICLGNRGNLTNGPAATEPLTEAKVLELWGKPDTIRTNSDNLTIWRYEGGRNWSLVLPAYIIALPIPVASGHNHVDLYFTDGIAQKASNEVEVVSGVFLCLIGPGSCICAWEKEPVKNINAFIAVGYGFDREKPASAARPPAPTGGTNRVDTVCPNNINPQTTLNRPADL